MFNPAKRSELSTQLFKLPKSPGKYSLIIELFVRNFDWFSNAGVIPAVVVADIQPGTTRFC